MSHLQQQKEAELNNVKLTAAEKVAINEKYAKKEAELIEAIKVIEAKTVTGATDGAAGTETNGNEETDTQK